MIWRLKISLLTIWRGLRILTNGTHENGWKNGHCRRCGRAEVIERVYPDGYHDRGPDPCLGELDGVWAACCGHGDPFRAYIWFKNGLTIRGFDTIERDRT